jgi:rod shape-determining protein MreD
VIWFDLRQRLAKLGRHSVPCIITLALLLATLLPRWPLGTPLGGVFTLATIYFWGLHRPAAMPPWLAGTIGLVGDLLGVAPLGVGMLCALLMRGVAGWLRRDLARATAFTIWGAFALSMASVSLLGWVLAAIASARWFDFSAAVTQPAIGIAAYPILSYFLQKADRVAFKP